MKYLLPILAAASMSFAQWGGWGGGGGGKTLNDYKKMSVSGREIHVYAPSDLKENSPLLISCHGWTRIPTTSSLILIGKRLPIRRALWLFTREVVRA